MNGEVRVINGKRVATSEYRSWQAMKNRCLNQRAQDYRHYGGRGITVCERWLRFDNFLADMGRRPTPLHTLDRVDSDGPYAPKNCRWATREEQARNRAYASVKAWEVAKELGLSERTVYHMMWQVREKDKGREQHFKLSARNEARIRAYMRG